jgi:hypothetical protein
LTRFWKFARRTRSARPQLLRRLRRARRGTHLADEPLCVAQLAVAEGVVSREPRQLGALET